MGIGSTFPCPLVIINYGNCWSSFRTLHIPVSEMQPLSGLSRG